MEESRNSESDREGRRGESGKPQNVQPDARKQKRYEGIDYDQILIDAAHYLGEYDTDVIYSWTPREFKNFLKGAKLRIIDSYELCAVQALFTGKVKNAKKKIKLKDIYDADKARKEFEKTMTIKVSPPKPDSGKYNSLKDSWKAYKI